MVPSLATPLLGIQDNLPSMVCVLAHNTKDGSFWCRQHEDDQDGVLCFADQESLDQFLEISKVAPEYRQWIAFDRARHLAKKLYKNNPKIKGLVVIENNESYYHYVL